VFGAIADLPRRVLNTKKYLLTLPFFSLWPRSLPSRVMLSNYHFHHQTLHLSFRNRRLRLQGGTVSVFNHCVDDICEIFRNQLINLQLIVAIK
jgi:hypothetical protein